MIEKSLLETALKKSWTRQTSSDPRNWSSDNPAWGQCAVTALIVNDYLGGEIVWARAALPDGRELSHYFNKILGFEDDLTRFQFPAGTILPKGVPNSNGYPSTRDYMLSYAKTQTRYEILKRKVQDYLK
jgi:hypothetical protein